MDISKYRDNVELSDICVVIDEHEFNLHKFPLSINSDYFKNECKTQSKVTLKKFPGGKASFEIIADHCYGKDVELTIENVGLILCAAEFLGMSGKNNLLEKCKKFIERIFRSSEYSHCIDGIIEFLQSCKSLKSDFLKPFVNRSYAIIMQIWLRPLSGYNSNLKEKYIEDSIVYGTILSLDFYFIKNIIKYCSEEESKYPFLAKLVVDYIEMQLIEKENESNSENKLKQKDVSVNAKTRKKSTSSQSSIELNEELVVTEENQSESVKVKIKTKKVSSNNTDKKRKIFDKILKVLPNEVNLGKVVSIFWLQKVLEFCKKYDCKQKNKLLQMCGGILTNLSIEDIKSMDPKSVTEMIEQCLHNDKVDKELMKWIWDNHFLEMAKNSELDPAVFNKVVKNMPESHHVDPDVVFKIVLSILNNIGSDGQKYKEELIDTVDLEKIAPENLELAVESKFWDAKIICKAAINRLKNNDKNKYSNQYSYKESTDNFETVGNNIKSHSCYGNKNKILSNYKSPSFTNYLDTYPSTYDDEINVTSPDLNYSHYPTTKYVYSSYSPDSYLTMEESLKCELSRISESYSDYYRKQYRSRSRRKYPIAHKYQY